MYGCMDGEADWRRVERLGTRYLYWQVATSEIPLVLFEWPGPAEPIRGSLYLTTFGLRKTFVLMRSRFGPHLVVAAYRGMGGNTVLPLCVASLLEGYCAWAARVLGETERALTEAHFEATYAEEPLPAPAPKAG